MTGESRSIALTMLVIAALLLAASIAAVLLGGPAVLDVAEAVRGDDLSTSLLWDIRLPRALTALLVGTGLAVAGAILQGVLRNDLAEPGILGLNAGGAFGVSLAVLFYQGAAWGGVLLLPAAAWLGSFMAFLVILLLSRRRGEVHPVQFLLVGIAINALLGTANSFLGLALLMRQHAIAVTWQAGSLGSAGWEQVGILTPLLLAMLLVTYWKAPTLNAMLLGRETAEGLGLRVGRTRMSLLALALGLSSCCVAAGGAIAFVGLLAPHIGRRLLGPNYRLLIPCAAAIGGILTLGADLVARTLFLPSQLPAGIVLAVLGVPYFLYLLKRA